MTHINLSRDLLLKLVNRVIGVVEKKHTLAILSNLLIKQTAHRLSVIATDLELQIEASENIQATKTFELTISAKKLQDVLRVIPENSEIQLEINQNKITIKQKRSIFNLQTLPSEDFPVIKEEENQEFTLKIEQQKLKSLLHKVAFSMANQDIRYYLNGIYIAIEQNKLILSATDGQRLALMSEFYAIETDKKQEIILPKKTVHELLKLLDNNQEMIDITINNKQIKFEFNHNIMISKVIDGKFPDYQRVFPKNNKYTIGLNKVELTQALQKTAILSDEKFKSVHFTLKNNKLTINCRNNEQEQAAEEIDIQYQEDDAINLSFNIHYLMDVLSVLEAETIFLHLNDNHSSVVITCAEYPEFKYVVMPMRV